MPNTSGTALKKFGANNHFLMVAGLVSASFGLLLLVRDFNDLITPSGFAWGWTDVPFVAISSTPIWLGLFLVTVQTSWRRVAWIALSLTTIGVTGALAFSITLMFMFVFWFRPVV